MFFFVQGLRWIDEQRAAGNDLFKLMCNVGPFETLFASSRQMISDLDKQDKLIQQISELQTEDVTKKFQDILSGTFDCSAVCLELITIIERYNVIFKDVMQCKVTSEVKTAIVGNLRILAELADPVVVHLMDNLTFVASRLGTLVNDSKDKLPDTVCIVELKQMGELKLMHPLLDKYFGTITKVVSNFGCDAPISCDRSIHTLDLCTATLAMITASSDLGSFLQKGELNLKDERMDMATTIMGSFFKALKEFENKTWPEKISPHFQAVSKCWRKNISPLAKELVTPLHTSFFKNIFTHKHLKDDLHVSFACLSVTSQF